ncbi:hypothetical protein ACP70R_000575 [Stipagrostis hirtigluma subsp. patula]
MAEASLFDLPTDVLLDILHRLPPSTRRRLRLVCKLWRDGIDERTQERQVRTKILVFVTPNNSGGSSRALVFDGEDGHRRHPWAYLCSDKNRIRMVGTCNGLLCLHESRWPGGEPSTITVTNPITRETAALPPAPAPPESEQFGKYSFGYHPTTGQYKVVHIPWREGRAAHAAALVFTLGGTSWRRVSALAAPGAGYDRWCDAISVDGWTYWATASPDRRVIALDLNDERITAFDAPPAARLPAEARWRLTNVHARLGLVVTTETTLEVWMMEERGEQPRWSHIVDVRRWWQWHTAPQLTFGRDMLSSSYDVIHLPDDSMRGVWRVYRQEVGGLMDGKGKNGQLQPVKGKELITEEDGFNGVLTTFAYVETLEPLPRIHG